MMGRYANPPEPDTTCMVCFGNPEGSSCLCEECPVCGEAGNPDCFLMLAADSFGHGMFMTAEQLWQRQNGLVAEYSNIVESRLAEIADYEFYQLCVAGQQEVHTWPS